MRSIFVSSSNALLGREGQPKGGVQLCTRDYLKTISAAGIGTNTVSYDTDRTLSSRLRRKIAPKPFEYLVPTGVVAEIETILRAGGVQWIFLNNSEPLALAAAIKKSAGDQARVVYLSHGVESTDQLNDLRLGIETVPIHRRQAKWIGKLFLAELEQRRHLDGVVCVSEEDVLFERWLGSDNVFFLPRSIRSQPLDWKPVPGRIGTVGTLTHIPNFDGVHRFAAELNNDPSVRLRVVGGPQVAGEKLAREFRCIDYVGLLDDNALKLEAATWCAFVNPIFCQARGVSTKIASALGWGLPVLTTRQGARGYRWDDSALPRVQTAKELAQLAFHVASGSNQKTWQAKASQIVKLAPSFAETGENLLHFLKGP